MDNINNEILFDLYQKIFSILRKITKMNGNTCPKKLKLKPVDLASVLAEKLEKLMSIIIDDPKVERVKADLRNIKELFINNSS